MMLLGISFLYGLSGSTLYADIQGMLMSYPVNVGFLIGIVLLISGIAFKLSLAPFHIWTPDVYEGAPFASVSFFSSALKLAALVVIINIMSKIMIFDGEIEKMIKGMAIISILIGSIGGIKQHSIKRLLGYSTIANMGFAITPFALSDHYNWNYGVIYIIVYSATIIGFFSTLSSCLGKNIDNSTFDDLSGLGKTRRISALIISILMFSAIGLPPFGGFFAKYYLLSAAITDQNYLLTFVMIVGSIISAYYYLKIIRVMYFAESIKPININTRSYELLSVSACAIIFISCFSFF
jgi:NADH-quinone oxidoreductase subunit N